MSNKEWIITVLGNCPSTPPLDWDIYLITVEPAITKCHSTEKNCSLWRGLHYNEERKTRLLNELSG